MPHEMLTKYEDEFDIAVNVEFPPNAFADLHSSYYNDGYAYFENFDGFGDYEVIGVEKNFVVTIENFKLRGFIDLILRDANGNITIVDHKSKAKFKSKAEQKAYGMQLYLYSKYVSDTYGVWPTTLVFNMFRKGNVVCIPFKIADYEEAVRWAQAQVNKIERCDDWEPTIDEFYCSALCDYRHSCAFSPCNHEEGESA